MLVIKNIQQVNSFAKDFGEFISDRTIAAYRDYYSKEYETASERAEQLRSEFERRISEDDRSLLEELVEGIYHKNSIYAEIAYRAGFADGIRLAFMLGLSPKDLQE